MLATSIEVVQDPMFNEDGPGCWMQKQAAWIPGFWPEGTVAGEDSSFFYFPPIEEEFGSAGARCRGHVRHVRRSARGACRTRVPGNPRGCAGMDRVGAGVPLAQPVGPGRLVHDIPDE